MKKICGDRKVEQMQAEYTFTDSVWGFVSLMVYTPRTAKVWCAEKNKGGVL